MHFNIAFLAAGAALATGTSVAPNTASSASASTPPYEAAYYITEFHAYHSPGAPAGLVFFDVTPGSPENTNYTNRCFGTAFSTNTSVLPNFNSQPCSGKTSDYQWSLKKNVTSGRWRFVIEAPDTAASYYFPTNAESTYKGNPNYMLNPGPYAQLKAPDNKFTTEGLSGTPPP